MIASVLHTSSRESHDVKRFPKIFISYQRDDTAGFAGRLSGNLKGLFGVKNVFRDRDNLPGGTRFKIDIATFINASDVILAVIGKNWLTRIQSPDNFIQLEIVAGLKRKESLILIPVLIEDAKLPSLELVPQDVQPLFDAQCVELRDSDWENDVNRLLDAIENLLEKSGKGEIVSTNGLRLDSSTSIIKPEKSRTPPFLWSLFGGSGAGLITALVVAIPYTLAQANVSLWRIPAAALFGLFAGALFSYYINRGMNRAAELAGSSNYAIVIGAVRGGLIASVLSTLVAYIACGLLEGDAPNPLHVLTAVSVSTIFIVLGILIPELTREWYKRILIFVVLAVVTFVILVTVKFAYAAGLFARLNNPVLAGIVLGVISGVVAGIQTGLAVSIYHYLRAQAEERRRS